ncbi:MAG: putative O-methyltransferase YrrM [Verrucomicrobia bacterium]|nr:MAG: putative O-methyltransferase YrrM [Verrucomicrobiota bacterium]
MISSVDDQGGAPTKTLVQKVLDAVQCAKDVDLSAITARLRKEPLFSPKEPLYPEIWPGEHYKLLAGFVESMRPRKVVEVGTYQGLSALALLARLPVASQLLTLDIVPWDEMRPTFLQETDFSDGRLRQVLGDLSQREFFAQFAPELSSCELLFIDAPKNVVFERTLLEFLETIPTSPNLLVVFDDIRQWNMLSIWRGIRRPKMDLTSFGHWSGTGVVEWNGCQPGTHAA